MTYGLLSFPILTLNTTVTERFRRGVRDSYWFKLTPIRVGGDRLFFPFRRRFVVALITLKQFYKR